MTHSTDDYFDYPRGRVIIVYTASTVFFVFSIGYYALLFTVPALICGLILSLTSTYRDLCGLIRAIITGSLCSCLYLLLFGADFITSLLAGVVIGGTYSLIVGLLSLPNPPGEDDIREPA
jgi:NADH dehydrogenase subunit 6